MLLDQSHFFIAWYGQPTGNDQPSSNWQSVRSVIPGLTSFNVNPGTFRNIASGAPNRRFLGFYYTPQGAPNMIYEGKPYIYIIFQ